jgi:hypothetical protein
MNRVGDMNFAATKLSLAEEELQLLSDKIRNEFI